MAKWDKSKKGNDYAKLGRNPGDSRLKWLRETGRLISSTIQQLTLGYGYFRGYLGQIPGRGTRYCYRQCSKIQTPSYLLLDCQNYQVEQSTMKAELGGARVTLAQLLTTEKGIASLATYLQKTKVAIRKWQLG